MSVSRPGKLHRPAEQAAVQHNRRVFLHSEAALRCRHWLPGPEEGHQHRPLSLRNGDKVETASKADTLDSWFCFMETNSFCCQSENVSTVPWKECLALIYEFFLCFPASAIFPVELNYTSVIASSKII